MRGFPETNNVDSCVSVTLVQSLINCPEAAAVLTFVYDYRVQECFLCGSCSVLIMYKHLSMIFCVCSLVSFHVPLSHMFDEVISVSELAFHADV